MSQDFQTFASGSSPGQKVDPIHSPNVPTSIRCTEVHTLIKLLRKLRQHCNLSQAELAERLGVREEYVTQLESLSSRPTRTRSTGSPVHSALPRQNCCALCST